ncbi:MAG: PIG-L family deacetylase [Verrucomicrobiota bacterium]
MSILKNPAAWERVLMFAPHPDDESMAAGGLLQRAVLAGARVRVVFVTNGDNNPWAQRAIERRWRIAAVERARWGERRRQEAISALACLGLPADCALFLTIPDQGVTDLLLAGDQTLVGRIAKEIAEFKPKLLITPALADLHRDHNSFAVILRLAFDRLNAEQQQFTELNFFIHQNQKITLPQAEVELRLSCAEQERKRQAILCHATQMKLSQRRFLAFAKETEHFAIRPQPKEQDENHPVKSALIVGKNLRLELARSSLPAGIFGKRILHVIGSDSCGDRVQRSIVLPARSAVINIVDSVSGSIVAQAAFRKSRGKLELLIPLSVFSSVQKIFVKLENRWHFYDEAGWREIPLRASNETFSSSVVSEISAPRICCVFPCYNVATSCGEVLRRVAERVDDIIAVNDGSTDGTKAVLDAVAAESGERLRVISYPDNRGKGVALLQGFRLALNKIPFDLLITIDADGQHNPEDIDRMVAAWADHRPGLLIGERLEFAAGPLRSRLGNSLTSTILKRFYPTSPSDTQSGLRGMDRAFVNEIVRSIKPQRYETELRILLLALELRLNISTIAIQTIYFDQNRLSHFRPVLDSMRIYWVLFCGLGRSFFRQRVTCKEEEGIAAKCSSRKDG